MTIGCRANRSAGIEIVLDVTPLQLRLTMLNLLTAHLQMLQIVMPHCNEELDQN